MAAMRDILHGAGRRLSPHCRWLLALGAIAALSACQTAAPPSGPAAAASAPASPAAAADPAGGLPPGAALAPEARWLGELFAGTPVRVSGERDGSVRLSVPVKYAYDTPSALPPRPPLQAVLDKLAQSLQRQPTARLVVSPPGAAVAAGRVAAIETHLGRRGVSAARVSAGSAAATESAVQLRLLPGPTAIRRLDDSQLPPPPPPPSAAR